MEPLRSPKIFFNHTRGDIMINKYHGRFIPSIFESTENNKLLGL
jgi:hypothetical protein